MKSFLKKYWYLTALLFITLLSYLSVFIPPTVFWPAVFASYAIPVLLGINAVLLIIIPFIKWRLIVFPLIGLLFGLMFISITYSYKGKKSSDIHDISILSFNAKLFRKAKMYHEFSWEMINWVAEDKSDIKCIQEYSTNARWEPLDVTKKNIDQGYYGFTHIAGVSDAVHDPGLAIFSKYQILDTGIVWKQPGTVNDGIYADVLVENDTLRIYNVHMASMNLALYQYKYKSNYLRKVKRLISRLKYGAEVRSSQVDKLVAHTNNCPYPFIVCGDFNETPYSYNYFKLKRQFSNTFEEAGNGFGFSLNSKLFFLRIDHHFISSNIEALDFRVDRSMKISDHFPTRGYYRLR